MTAAESNNHENKTDQSKFYVAKVVFTEPKQVFLSLSQSFLSELKKKKKKNFPTLSDSVKESQKV